jgi:hypothetical protein
MENTFVFAKVVIGVESEVESLMSDRGSKNLRPMIFKKDDIRFSAGVVLTILGVKFCFKWKLQLPDSN